MNAEIPDEYIAIIARRSEWAGLLCELAAGGYNFNSGTVLQATSFAYTPSGIIDKIINTVITTQFRIETSIPPNLKIVKILKSKYSLQPPLRP